MSDPLQREIRFLKGVGEKRAALYEKLGIATVGDLLHHLPRSYIDLTHPQEIYRCPLGESCAVRAMVLKKSGEQRIRRGLSLFKVTVGDDSGNLSITFFNAKFTVDALQVGEEYLFYGRMEGGLTRRAMSAPMVFPLREAAALLPIYPLTQGLTSRMIGQNVRQALSLLPETLEDPLPNPLREAHRLCHLRYALENIHYPADEQAAAIARKRFVFEELLILCLALGSLKHTAQTAQGCPMPQQNLAPFFEQLPFAPTGAQRRVIGEVARDLAGSLPMNRLVEGDVGSGKTLIAAAACYLAAKNGYQSVVMAPTAILAEQHYQTLQALLSPLGISVGLLTGSQKAAEKRQVRQALAAGELAVCAGTHALISQGVEFARIGCVVTDEQHRFGVSQRLQLQQKAQNPHVLVMSATPIPRTLALIIYGDLELSVIDELPPGRQPVATYRIDSSKRQRALGFIRRHLDQGLQAYIVCPLVEAGEADPGLKAATDYADELAAQFFSGYRVGLLHGRMKAAEKEGMMARFKAGEVQLLIATTVIEVGVDVPNAVIMMIENAERFGLSQLHQLRGRVGRGQAQSHCILLTDARGEATLERLDALCHTTDGFKVAEFDLKQRGPGDFFGERQHGLPALKIADLSTDMGLLAAAKQAADALLQTDAALEMPEHRALRALTRHMLDAVGERPN